MSVTDVQSDRCSADTSITIKYRVERFFIYSKICQEVVEHYKGKLKI